MELPVANPLKSTPLLSVCVPTYNRVQWLRPMLMTVVGQLKGLEDRVEIVVSDNASTDGTANAVRDLQETIGPIRYSRNDVNVGGEPNFFKAIHNIARGKYAWLLGDDDFLVPGALSRVVAAIEQNPDIDYFYVNYRVFRCATPPIAGDPLPQPDPNALHHLDLIDGRIDTLSQIVGGDANLFTPMSCSIMPRERLAEAIYRDPALEAFSSAQSVSPISMYIARHCLQKPAYCFGEPLTLLGTASSWEKYLPAFTLIVLPELYDHYEKHGASREKIDVFRRALCGYCGDLYRKIRTDPNVPGHKNFSLLRFVRRNRRIRGAYTLHYRVFVQPKYVATFSRFFWTFGPSKAVLSTLRGLWHQRKARPSVKGL